MCAYECHKSSANVKNRLHVEICVYCVPQRPPVVVCPLSWSAWAPLIPTVSSSRNSSSRWGSPHWSSRTMTWTPSDRAWPHLRCPGITCTPMVKSSAPHHHDVELVRWMLTGLSLWLVRKETSFYSIDIGNMKLEGNSWNSYFKTQNTQYSIYYNKTF